MGVEQRVLDGHGRMGHGYIIGYGSGIINTHSTPDPLSSLNPNNHLTCYMNKRL